MARTTSQPEPKKRRKRKEKDPEGRMSLGEHLAELRDRLLWCAGAVVVFTIVGWLIYPWVFEMLNRPFLEAQQNGVKAYANMATIGSPLDVKLRISAYIGLILAAPMIMYQAWMYVVPGLHRNERRYALGFFGAGIPLFAVGCVMGYIGMTRLVPVLLGFAPGGDDVQIVQNVDFNTYLQMFIKTMLAFGIAFVMPVVLVLLNFMGVLRGMTMLRAWRWVVFLCFAFIAILVPTPDPLTLIGMTLPVIALYFIAIGIACWHDRKMDQRSGSAADGPSSIEAPIAVERLDSDRGRERDPGQS